MHVLDGDELRRALPMSAAIDALEAGFRTQDPSARPLRSHLATRAGSLLLMPAFGDGGVGVKLVTLTPDNPDRDLPYIGGVYVLFDAVTQTPEAIVDGAALTALRTAAVSGLATRHLANPDAERLVIFGAGVQARSHLEAMVAVRPIRHVTVVSRTPERSRALVAEARDRGIGADVGDVDALAGADADLHVHDQRRPALRRRPARRRRARERRRQLSTCVAGAGHQRDAARPCRRGDAGSGARRGRRAGRSRSARARSARNTWSPTSRRSCAVPGCGPRPRRSRFSSRWGWRSRI